MAVYPRVRKRRVGDGEEEGGTSWPRSAVPTPPPLVGGGAGASWRGESGGGRGWIQGGGGWGSLPEGKEMGQGV